MAVIEDISFRVDNSAIDETVAKLEKLTALVKELQSLGLPIETILASTYTNVRGEEKNYSGIIEKRFSLGDK